jgi:hypothetical protein
MDIGLFDKGCATPLTNCFSVFGHLQNEEIGTDRGAGVATRSSQDIIIISVVILNRLITEAWIDESRTRKKPEALANCNLLISPFPVIFNFCLPSSCRQPEQSNSLALQLSSLICCPPFCDWLTRKIRAPSSALRPDSRNPKEGQLITRQPTWKGNLERCSEDHFAESSYCLDS